MGQKIRMIDNNVIEMPDNATNDEIFAYIDEYERIVQKGTSEFLRPGQSATEPEDVSTAGMGVGTEAGRAEAFQKFASVPTLGMQDEAIAGLRSALGGESYGVEKAKQLAQESAFEKLQPVTATAAEVVGSLYLPGTTMKTPFLDKIIKDMKPMSKAMIKSGVAGSIYGGMEAEQNEFIEGLKTGGLSSAMSMPAYVFANGIYRFKELAKRAEENKKAVFELEGLTNRAYEEALTTGDILDISQSQQLLHKVGSAMEEEGFRMNTYGSTSKRVYKDLQENLRNTMGDGRRAGEPMDWNKIDKMRQDMWKDWATARAGGYKRDQDSILAGIKALDDAVNSFPGKGQQFKNARELYKTKQRADILNTQIDKAIEQAGATGSGGNKANRIIQAINKVRDSKTMSSFFTQEQLGAMEALSKSYGGARLSRSLSKLAPNGNGLMLFLQAYGAYAIDPTIMSSMLFGTAMQKRMENMAERGARQIVSEDVLGRQPIPKRPEVGDVVQQRPYGNQMINETTARDLPSIGRRGAIGGINLENAGGIEGLMNFLAP